jgi:hypothetical protein
MKNILPIAIIIAAVIIGGAIYITQKEGSEVSPSQEVADNTISYINANMLPEGMSASLMDITRSNGLYKLRFTVGEEEIETYVSLDGKLFFPQVIPMGVAEEEEIVGEAKRDIPDVKLFVMSYCPYGLQTQKALLPAYNLLKDKASIGVYFVNYIMHEKIEIDENLNQYCIQKEQIDKFSSYLSCFLEAGDSSGCLASTGIDTNMLSACISAADAEFKITELYNDKSTWLNGRFPKFDVHASLNEQYGVGGSPTVVINDRVVSLSSRSPEAFKQAICEGFNTPPDECSEVLSTEVASPGLGGGTGGSDSGSCE